MQLRHFQKRGGMSTSPGLIALFCMYILALAATLGWSLSGGPPLEVESTLRIVTGSLLFFLLPGLVWGEILGFRSRHSLETIGLSWAITLSIEVVLLPIPFLFSNKIVIWVVLLFGTCVTGMILLWRKLKKGGQELAFLNPLISLFSWEKLSEITQWALIIGLAAGAYRVSENMFAISGEKLVHLRYVRFYFSSPMNLADFGAYPGTPAANLVHLWEYIIAAWATAINMDPLPVFSRARFVLPLFGLPGMYLLIAAMVRSTKKSETIFWGVLIMAIAQFMLFPPTTASWQNALAWMRQEEIRGLMSFLSTAHHGDSAMDLLLAPCAALIIGTIRAFSWRSLLLLTGLLSGTFLWHPREFFITATYAGTYGFLILMTPSIKKRLALKRWLLVMTAFFAVAGTLLSISSSVVKKQSLYWNEFGVKKAAVQNAFAPENLFRARFLGDFPLNYFALHLAKDPLKVPKKVVHDAFGEINIYPWLLLSAAAIPLLALLGNAGDKRIALYFALLWFLLFSWHFSMLMVMALTFSEMYLTTPRMIYLFSYLVIAASFYALAKKIMTPTKSWTNRLIFLSILACGGVAFHVFWNLHALVPLIRAAKILTLGMLASVPFLLMPGGKKERPAGHPPLLPTLGGIILFFFLLYGGNFRKIVTEFFIAEQTTVDWFGDSNPLGFSKKLISQLRSLPPKRTFLVDPQGQACVFIYAPHSVATYPTIISTMHAHVEEVAEAEAGRHPFFRPKGPEHDSVLRHLKTKNADYILVNDNFYYGISLKYFRRFPKDYEIVFNNPDASELMARYLLK